MHWRKSHNTTDPTQIRPKLPHSIYGTKRQKIVKSQMEPYKTREDGPAVILSCHSGPHTELQTAYTQYKDEGGHTKTYSSEIGKLEVGHKCKHG